MVDSVIRNTQQQVRKTEATAVCCPQNWNKTYVPASKRKVSILPLNSAAAYILRAYPQYHEKPGEQESMHLPLSLQCTVFTVHSGFGHEREPECIYSSVMSSGNQFRLEPLRASVTRAWCFVVVNFARCGLTSMHSVNVGLFVRLNITTLFRIRLYIWVKSAGTLHLILNSLKQLKR